MPLILGTNSIKASGYDVANSARFGNIDGAGTANDTLTRTPSGASNRKTFTISFWMKRSELQTGDTLQQVIGQQATGYFRLTLGSNEQGDIFRFYGGDGFEFRSKIFVRDVAAWYHVVLAMDTTQGTEANRAKLYVNGVQQTEFYTANYPGQNVDQAWNIASEHRIGSGTSAGGGFAGYLCEVINIDGAALDPTSFGEVDSDSGIWKPKDVSGLTFGTNGFYLDFADSGDLGDDESGNGNDFAETGLDATHQSTDTCTNNFCVMNSLENYYQAATLTEGNLKLLTATTSNTAPSLATFALTKGKWYYEAKYVSDSLAVSSGAIGIVGTQVLGASNSAMLETAQKYGLYLNDGNIWHNNSKVQDLGSHIDHTATIGISLDFDNNRITFSKNGGWGDGSGNWDEAAPNTFYTVAAPSAVDFKAYFPAFGDWSSGSIGYEINFGAPMYAISSSNSDADGFGNFEYPVPSGHFAICTKNLAEYG